jgi:hypothetical protein
MKVQYIIVLDYLSNDKGLHTISILGQSQLICNIDVESFSRDY